MYSILEQELRHTNLVRHVERKEMALIEVVDGRDESGPNFEFVLRHEDGGFGVVEMTTNLLHLQHFHRLTEENVEHLSSE